MRIILLGAPGSGKGTQGPILAKHFGGTHLSTGELLRREIVGETELGQQVRSYVEAGELVPDEIIFEESSASPSPPRPPPVATCSMASPGASTRPRRRTFAPSWPA